jgi:hypothetical protein
VAKVIVEIPIMTRDDFEESFAHEIICEGSSGVEADIIFEAGDEPAVDMVLESDASLREPLEAFFSRFFYEQAGRVLLMVKDVNGFWSGMADNSQLSPFSIELFLKGAYAGGPADPPSGADGRYPAFG